MRLSRSIFYSALKSLVILVLLMADGGPGCAASNSSTGTLTTIDALVGQVPMNGEGTYATVINNAGIVAGHVLDLSHLLHGFIRDTSGVVTLFDAPIPGGGQSSGTLVSAINSSGAVAGTANDGGGNAHGYIRDSQGTFTAFDAPWPGALSIIGLNDQGTCLGAVSFTDQKPGEFGFLRSAAGKFYRFAIAGYNRVVPANINNFGVVVGAAYSDSSTPTTAVGFVRTPDGNISTFSVANAVYTYATGINNHGLIVGQWQDASFIYHGFLKQTNGSITSFDVPGVKDTQPLQVNDSGVVVGAVIYPDYATNGFERFPSGDYYLPFESSAQVKAMNGTDNNNADSFVGWYQAQNLFQVYGYLVTFSRQ